MDASRLDFELSPNRAVALNNMKQAALATTLGFGIGVLAAGVGHWRGAKVGTVFYALTSCAVGFWYAEKNPFAGGMLAASGMTAAVTLALEFAGGAFSRATAAAGLVVWPWKPGQAPSDFGSVRRLLDASTAPPAPATASPGS